MRNLKSLFLAVAVIVFFAIVAAIIVQSKPEPPKSEAKEPVFSVRTVQATPLPRRPSVLLVGEVEARDYAVLTAPVEAEVAAIAVREGESFKKKQRLIRLDLREQRLQIRAQDANVETVEVQLVALKRNRQADQERLQEVRTLLKLSQQSYTRNLTLNAKNLVTQSQLETSEAAVTQRRLEVAVLQNQVDNYGTEEQRLLQQLESAKVALAQAQLLTERGEMHALFAGRVVKVHTSVGARPSRGEPLIEIYNPNSVFLRASMPNRYVSSLSAEKDKVQARLVQGGELLDLPLANIAPRTNAGQGSVEVLFDLPEGTWILGATHEFQLQLPPIKDALELPFEALYGESRVYIVGEDNRVHGVECERLGVSRREGEVLALVRCPQVVAGDGIVATQLPGIIAEGTKVQPLANKQ